MRIGTLVKAPIGVAIVALLAACGAQGSESARGAPAQRAASSASTVPSESPPPMTSRAAPVSAQRLIDYFSRTLNSGPTHVVLMERAGYPELLLVDGVLDVPRHAAMLRQFNGINSVDLTVDGVNYMCDAYDRIHRYAPGYCDASFKWLQTPAQYGLDAAQSLAQRLNGPVTPVRSATDGVAVRRLGDATIRGAVVAGFAFELTASSPRPTHEDVVMWLDNNDMVREVELIGAVSAPGLTPLPSDSADGLPGIAPLTPDPELQKDQAELEQTTPGGVANYAEVAGQASFVMVAQIFDIGTAPVVTAPPPDAVELFPPSG